MHSRVLNVKANHCSTRLPEFRLMWRHTVVELARSSLASVTHNSTTEIPHFKERAQPTTHKRGKPLFYWPNTGQSGRIMSVLTQETSTSSVCPYTSELLDCSHIFPSDTTGAVTNSKMLTPQRELHWSAQYERENLPRRVLATCSRKLIAPQPLPVISRAICR